MDAPPFRLTLDQGSERHLSAGQAEMFVRLAANGHERRIAADEALDVVQNGSEAMAWMLVGQVDRIDPVARRADVENALIGRALADADASGVVWTRLLDHLAHVSSYATDRMSRWARAVEQVRAGARPGLPAETPKPTERIRGLRPWVEARSEPAELQVLLDAYRSTAVQAVVARFGRCLTAQQADYLRKIVPASLAKNPHLGGERRAEGVLAAVKEMIEQSRSRLGYSYASQLPKPEERLLAFCRSNEPLPPELQREVLRMAARKDAVPVAAQIYESLTKHSALELATLTRLAEVFQNGRDKVLAHPNATAELREAILASAANRASLIHLVLRNPAASAHLEARHLNRFLDSLLARSERASADLALIIHHPASTPEMWERAALPWEPRDREIMDAVARRAEARHHHSFRKLLLKSRAQNVLEALLQDANAEEFPSLLRALLARDPKSAWQVLRTARVPDGLHLPKSLQVQLLQSQDADDRLAAMTLLAKVTAPDKPAKRTRRSLS